MEICLLNKLQEHNMNDTIQWTIVGLAILGFVFNTGIIWNDVKHLKKSVNDIWKEINHIKTILIKERDTK